MIFVKNPNDTSQAFNDHFSSVFNHVQHIPDDPLDSFSPIPELSRFSVSISDILNILISMPTNKPPGPDGIHPRIIKETASFPSSNHLLPKKIVPDILKRANITSVYKQGDRGLVINYRPVALTSVLCKT